MVSNKFARLVSWSLLSIAYTQAALLSNIADIPTNVQFDFIIVGGGTAGNVVANRLTENPKVQVLVLEAGPSDDGVLLSQVPYFSAELVAPSQYEWNYTTTTQPGLSGRAVPYPRGHILGGSSSTNWLVYTRGSSEDYDRYAKVTGDLGWSWKNLYPYFKKSERWTAPVDNHDTTGQFTPSVHGYSGEVGVSLSGSPSAIDSQVITASSQLGGPFKFNQDMNSGNEIGLGWVQSTIKGGSRSSSSTAYLAPQFIARKNLWVVVNAQVSRVLQTSRTADSVDANADGTADATGFVPLFRSVEFRNSAGGPLKTLTATREVILSAGAVGTPHILLNSGIGNSNSLTSLGIRPIVNLPDVGENLSDHPVVATAWFVNSTDTTDNFRRGGQLLDDVLQQWQTTKTGPLVNPILNHLGFARISGSLAPQPDTAAGPNSPHYEYIVANGGPPGPTPPTGNFMTMVTVLVSPSSRGSIKLRSNNPFDSPVIDPALLKTTTDKLAMRASLKAATNFVTAPVWNGYIMNRAGAFADATTDAKLDSFIAANTGTLFHPVGTARMSPKGASNGVTDPDLRVKKVSGLRIVDLSVLPFVPAGHTVASAYVVGERASDLIKFFHKL
ncbi:alcohol oxidase [Collybia nuda]|uniref:Alcohol oxidase n=1 Tax=Collybia nuda TaxID=64659 RepID=A0A9P6CCJ4_9AGAR|nr:alcohol oxidase [Collybia nuda]